MRKSITIIIGLALGFSLYASDNTNDKYGKDGAPTVRALPEYRTPSSRTEEFELYMEDSYGDGWNGAFVDLFVNGVATVSGATVGADDNDGEYNSVFFNVEDGDEVYTQWGAGAYDSECSYGIYDAEGYLVVESGPGPIAPFTINLTPSDPGALVIAGILDLTVPEGGNSGKAVVVQALADIEDLSDYGIGTGNNGGGTDGQEYTFPEMAMAAGSILWVVRDADAYAAYFGTDFTDQAHVVADGAGVDANGDDGYELYCDGAVSDVYGDVNVDGSGLAWEFLDSWAHRNCDALFPSPVFDLSQWTLGTPNCSDGSTNNEDTSCPYPAEPCEINIPCDLPHDLTINMFDSYGDGWNGNVLTIGDASFTIDAGEEATASICLDDGSYSVTCDGGDWQSEVSWSIVDASGTEILAGGAPYSDVLALGETSDVPGCTDPDAVNYDADATVDDGSCYYAGDFCDISLEYTGGMDGTDPMGGTTDYPNDVEWYHFTLDTDYDNLNVSLVGSDFDTQLEVWAACDADSYIGYNDDYDDVQSQVNLFSVAAGTYYAKIFGYDGAYGNYVFTVAAFDTPNNPSGLSALGGLERVYLDWNPSQPDPVAAGAGFDGTIDEQLEWQYENKKQAQSEITSARGVTREMMYERLEAIGAPDTRDASVIVTLFDSYGDGHYGGDSDGDAYVVDSEGNVLHTLEGPWTGAEASFGPFDLVDGVYGVQWDETAPWLAEQTMEVTDAADSNIVYGDGAAPTACFAIGDGNVCGAPDLTVTAVSYDGWSGRATVSVSNIGAVDAGYFYTMAFIQDPDTTQIYPPGYFQYAWDGDGLAAGESMDLYLSDYLTLPGFVGGYDDATYTLYAMADGYGNYVLEDNEGNNVGSTTVVNSNPLGNSTWNVYRSDAGADAALIANISAPDWQPGLSIGTVDEALTADVEYCYHVTQVDGTTESDASNTACATPSSPPDVPEPSDLAGSSSGFNVTLTWTSPDPYEGAPALLTGTPSSRQGGETVDDATVIDELPYTDNGTTVGYTDDYDEVCPYTGATSPDVVYSITPATNMAVNVSTCYSAFDSKLYVYEGTAGTLALTTSGADACSDDAAAYPFEDCTIWTSYIEGVSMTAGVTYYVVVDGYGYSEGDYQLDITQYDPLAGFTIWSVDGDNYSAVGQADPSATEWQTVLFAAEPTDVNLAITANYLIPGIVDPVMSDVVGPVTVTVQIEDNPNALQAMDYGADVHLMWEPPIDASGMELAYDDGVVANAWYYAGAVAVRFRVNGTYGINGLANSVWTGGWPDAYLGETPFTLSVLAVDPETDLPGDTLVQHEVLVDADPTSDTYGWAMVEFEENLVVDGDVFVMYSDFGYDFENNAAGPDMDMMGCDAVLDFPGNKYSYNVAVLGEWALDIDYGALGCGDWILHMYADFTVGDGASFSSWVNPMGAPSSSELPGSLAGMEAASTKDMPMELSNPPVSGPIWNQSIDREMLSYKVYRDDAHVGNSDPMDTEYWDEDLDWGTYTYHVTAEYDDHESIATNSIEVTLSNVAPDAVMLISPGNGLEINLTENNADEEVAFIWTAANDADNDLVDYYLGAFSTDIGADTVYNVIPDNSLGNGDFEDATMQENEWQYLPDGWEGYPNQNNQTVVFTGEAMYNSEDLFEAYNGDASLKLWGLYDGENTENNIFQTFLDGELAVGTEFWLDAALMSHNADFIGQGGNSVVLFAKYFTADWGWVGMDASEPFDGSYDSDEWYWFGVDCVVPEGASTVQVGAMLIQPTGDDHGSVYIDEMDMFIPLVTTGVFVTNGDLAAAAIDAGVSEMTWTWDVWASDGYEYTPSSSGPRTITVDVSDVLGVDGVSLPTEFALFNNYPNPFNPVTNITYDIPEVSDVTLEIYNVMGQRVRTLATGSHEPGRYQIMWNATNDYGQGLSSGMYIYRIQAGDFVSVKKLVLMK